MSRVKSVKLNMVMNALLTMSSFIFPLITFPYVSRVLLPVGTGKVAFANSVVTYFSMFAQLGIPTYGIRACAKLRNNKEKLSKIVHELLFINLSMCVLVYIVFGLTIMTVSRLNQDLLLFFMMGSCILLNALGVEWLYKALEQYSYITVRSIIFKFIALLAMFLLVHNQDDYVIYGLITIFAASASNILNFINLRKYIIIKPFKNYQIKRHLKMIVVFIAMSIATTIYTNLDNVMLGFMTTDEEVGYYGAAVKIKNILISLVTSASAVLLPRASYYVDRGMIDEFKRILKKTMHFVVLISVPFAIYFFLFSREGIFFLSGDAFAGSILPMQVIMPTLVLVGMTNVTGIQMMVPLGMEKQVLYSEIMGAVVDLILNTIFIPKYGATGAALGTLAAEGVVLIWQLLAIKSYNIHIYKDISFVKILLATVIAIVSSIWTKSMDWSYLHIIVVSSFCFFGIYGCILLIFKEKLIVDVFNMFVSKLKGR